MDITATISRIILVIAGVSLAAGIIEAVVLKFVAKRPYDWRAALVSLAMFQGYAFSNFIPLVIALPGAYWLYEHRLFEPAALGVWSFVLLLLGLEFFYYWWHRFSHRVRWFWVTHVAHHTSNDLNIMTSFRIGWTGRIMATYVVFAPLLLLGYSPKVMLTTYGLIVIYQSWIHVEWIPKLGFLEGILNTPSAHRVHHGGNLEYVDANYGAVLMIFDRLFGTYRPERDDVPVRYGLVSQVYSYNPFKLAFYQVMPIVRDLRRARSVREVFGYLFAPPGWQPDGSGTTTEDLRRRAAVAQERVPDGPGSQLTAEAGVSHAVNIGGSALQSQP